MSTIVDLGGLDRIVNRFKALGAMRADDLMLTWQEVIVADNRKGVLAGLDKDGVPMTPVTYRPKGPTVGIRAKSAARFRNNAKPRIGEFAGFGPHAAGLNNNLTTREYEQLTGPPLAPRGEHSRVITNLQTAYEWSSDLTRWTAYGAWFEVVSAKGSPFLHFHFEGIRYHGANGSRKIRRDLRGVRPEGRDKARRAAIAWMADKIRFYGASNAA